MYLSGITLHQILLRSHVHDNLYAFWDGALQEFDLLFKEGSQVHGLLLAIRLAAEVQDLADHAPSPMPLLDDGLQFYFSFLWHICPHGCQLGKSDNTGEGIVEIMGDSRCQLAHRSQSVLYPHLLFHPFVLSNISKGRERADELTFLKQRTGTADYGYGLTSSA